MFGSTTVLAQGEKGLPLAAVDLGEERPAPFFS
jgi:hypothetical protein